MSLSTGWYVAIGTLIAGAIWKSRRPGEMNEARDRIYRECLSGRVAAEKMRELAGLFEKARCFPQARMLRLRSDLKDLPAEIKEIRTLTFQRGMASRNAVAILRTADAFEAQGATTSAAKLRAHAARLPSPVEAEPIVTPPPADPTVESPPTDSETASVSASRHGTNGSSAERGSIQPAGATGNGLSHVAISETHAVVN